MTLLVTYLLLTLILSFMCSLLEATLLSSTSSYIESLDKKGYSPKTVDLAKDVKQNIDKSISSILTLNTFANTMGAAGVGAQAAIIFGSNWQAVIAFILTLMVLFISEIFPKTLGAIYWRKFIVPAVYIISFMVKITYPFIFIATFITNTLQKGRKNEVNFSKDEIITIVNMSEKEGVLQAKESILIKNLFKLKNIKAKDIMTPRTVVFAFDSKTTLKEALLNDNLYVYSRIPVYNESIDDIAGVVFKQTILEKRVKKKKKTLLKDIIVPVHKVPENISVSTLFDMFIRMKMHLFIVQDEYGQTSGVVTLEDALETLLGIEIVDEMDQVTDMQEFAKDENKRLQRL
ncbi:CNNM domain-containing protein [Aliarcobacter cryaerophilus]|uniref:CNNM domain-containing protein n=5 Tax=Arcobacteraceae TaxID=2808963 RepID=A0AA96E0E4_9BACT|nr:CNNM domain-containing protein [Aliarcobacter cryaerophilus]WNL28218.1 CNNM domain-containing protein [Arcobacter sp. AZ-2023]WPD04627.1 CNNM domain-containing protein [Arcobacter sp. DSM 115956]WPD06722.1 CNNM domain-containing protein [Arcobacter sp. DSM 115955]WPD11714.1 CNNM domain-containing protein [Arcobacter sp. DSM 115960]MCT7501164.1 CNNM domain-containing protein [Aliarcobacter cryaerophilus]